MSEKRTSGQTTRNKAPSPLSVGLVLLAGVVVGLGAFFVVRRVQGNRGVSSPADAPAKTARGATGFDTLKGLWVREDGYVIEVKAVDASGKIDAGYLNPRPINVSKAQATRRGDALEVFVELRDAGYPGCTYTLTYDQHSDMLTGVYYQAAQQQRYDVQFARMR